MKRRRWALLLAGLVALLAVIWGALVVAGLSPGGEEGVTKPSGTRNVLRVEPVISSVTCSDQKRTVLIFLDDLEARPSLTGSEANRGFAAFELTLHYDPKILQIEVPLDVRLNPGLSLEDPDGDGLARNFIPGPTTIDNFAGTVYMGAVGIGPGTEEGKREEGPDPVAKGAPLLLFSVEFLTVGEGTSPLTVTDAGVADSAVGQYTPLEIKESGITVSGGKCVEPLPATPRPTQVLPPAPPTPTPPVIPTPVELTPVPAAEGGRPDCSADWAAYDDPDGRFSVCYPAGLRAVRVAAFVGAGQVVQAYAADVEATVPENRVFFLAYWKPSAYLEGPGPSTICVSTQLGEVSREEATITVAGIQAPACFSTVNAIIPDVGVSDVVEFYQIVVEVPCPSGGYLYVRMTYSGPDFEASRATLMRMLDSVTLR